MDTYTKLFHDILGSSIWDEGDQTRLVWITLLAMADKNGVVRVTAKSLARFARVELEDCEKALQVFLAPDPESRSREYEGRRIEPVDGGWRLLNHAKYREKGRDRSDYMREYMRGYRTRAEVKAKVKGLTDRRLMKGPVALAERMQQQAEKDGDEELRRRLEEIREKENPAAAEFREEMKRAIEAVARAEAEARKAPPVVVPVAPAVNLPEVCPESAEEEGAGVVPEVPQGSGYRQLGHQDGDGVAGGEVDPADRPAEEQGHAEGERD